MKNEPVTIATSSEPEYMPMELAPTGAKCILLTRWGIAVIGVVPSPGASRGQYAAWCPLPKVPDWAKATTFIDHKERR